MEDLLAAREILKSSLEKSRDVASAINKIGPTLEEMNRRLPSLEAAIKLMAGKCAIYGIREHVDCVLGPAAAVLKVFDAVNELEDSLSANDPCSDLPGYLSTVKQLEEALKFLTDNCKLLILWLEDAVQFLEDNNAVSDDWYLINVKKSLKILEELQAMEERSRLNGGLLHSAFHKLEEEFRRLLTDSRFAVSADSSLSSLQEQACIVPLPVIQKLQCIVEILSANNMLGKCIYIYVDVRSSNARTVLRDHDLDYLETTSLSEFDSVQSVENHIDQWGIDLEFAVKHLLELECALCNDVFQKVELDVRTDCFSKIAARAGISDFIKFGNAITEGKKDAVKLLKLLDIFSALNNLRLDFNRLFGGKACAEIQSQTRDLIKKVVNGVCEIFWDLSVQVELQRQSGPPNDGSVPRLVSFVTNYCNQLLDDSYKPILTQVLEIDWNWRREKFEEGLLPNEISNIMKALELNLETWAKTYKDTALSYLFLMNNHWYLCSNLQGTKVGDLMGDSWLRQHEVYTQHYATAYFRESWGKLPALLSDQEDLTATDLVRKRIKTFSEAFEGTYRKQLNWVVFDKGLRWKMCQQLVQVLVPIYRNYVNSYYMPSVEEVASPSKSVKYTAERLENMLSSLFEKPKLGKYDNAKCTNTHLICKIKNGVMGHFSSTPAAA
ncbi:hypothetical protein RJ640_008293 [Escallonia rubra]|uniref:Exocyst subunit Exo70 family protein n=1 Tax=Escallonia rubra TaxID=112253 RepID=A0AA88QNA2_9ASTE|nr:hypothetical protein RJ640_008293 [Escallonia rubra]